MRYQPEHKAEVRRKILKDASRLVRAEGISRAAVSSVMRDAGLTHGGFYKHFGSKDDLLTESLSEAFRRNSRPPNSSCGKVPTGDGLEGDCEGLPERGTL
jgi:TetR/AcrR family transcriptional repressor of nem operon